MLAVRFLKELRPMPDVAAAAMAQTARRELADAIQYRDWCRAEFSGWPSDVATDALREAQDEAEYALARVREFEV